MSEFGKKSYNATGNNVQPRGACGLMCSLIICPQAEAYCKCSGSTKQATSKEDKFTQ